MVEKHWEPQEVAEVDEAMTKGEATVQDLQTLAAQLRDMRDTIAAQQEIIARQQAQLARLEAAQARQQLPRKPTLVEAESSDNPARASRGSGRRTRRADRAGARSRRALLKGAGAAAAAATVALVASEGQAAHAAPATDGQPLVVGSPNSATLVTYLTLSGGTARVLDVDASGSTYAPTSGYGPIGIWGVANVPSGGGASSAVGVWGTSLLGTGVVGSSDSSYGVNAQSTTGVDLISGGTGRMQQNLQGSAGAPTGSGTTYNTGEMIRDKNGELWLCVLGGAPGTWVQAAHLPSGYSGGAISYLSQSIRLLDTRGGDDLAKVDTGGPIAPGSPYPVPIANVNWQGVQVPATAVGAIGNVTAVATSSGGGYLALVPHGTPFSGTALLAFSANQIVSNSFNVALSGGQLDIIIGGSNPTDVVLDLFAVIA